RRLPRPVRAEQPEDAALLHGEVQAGQRLSGAEALGQPLRLDCWDLRHAVPPIVSRTMYRRLVQCTITVHCTRRNRCPGHAHGTAAAGVAGRAPTTGEGLWSAGGPGSSGVCPEGPAREEGVTVADDDELWAPFLAFRPEDRHAARLRRHVEEDMKRG